MGKKLRQLLLSLAIVICMGVSAFAAAAPNVMFESSKTMVEPGDTFTVTMKAADTISGVYSVSPLIRFDNTKLTVTDLKWDSTLPKLMENTVEEANSKGYFTAAYFDKESWIGSVPITSDTVFVEVTFRVNEGVDGTASITTEPEFADQYGQKMDEVILNRETIVMVLEQGAITPPSITTSSLSDGIKGSSYNRTLQATSEAPITWSLKPDSGNLPNGLALSTAGVISGTPTTVGTFNFTVVATNEGGTDEKALMIRIKESTGGSGSGGSGGGGGGTTTPAVQLPTIEAGEGVKVSLSADGTTATITVEEGYELADVVLNGTSKGKVTEVKGLKTGDKLAVTATRKEGYLTAEEQKKVDTITGFKLAAKSKQVKLKSGKRAIRITWNTSEYQFDGVQVWRSMKKNSGYGKKPMWTIKAKNTTYYYNTSIKKGKTYYYKLRGYVEINGQKYYTSFSSKVYRKVK